MEASLAGLRAPGIVGRKAKGISPQRHKDHTKGHKEDRRQKIRRQKTRGQKGDKEMESGIFFVPFLSSDFYLILIFLSSLWPFV
jgi:hypothetical protein